MDFLKDKNALYLVLAGALVWFVMSRKKNLAVSSPAINYPSQEKITEQPTELVLYGEKTIVSEPTNNERTVVKSTADLIKRLEGVSLKPYKDADGYSVGYGHFLGREPGAPISQERAEQFLIGDLGIAARAINETVKVNLSRNQFDALVSFVFNVGTSAFRKSTMLKRLNSGDYTGAAQEFRKWIHSGGQMNVGLVRRRTVERELFERG